MNLIAEKYSDDRCCLIDAVLAFGWLFFVDKEVKCSDLYTHVQVMPLLFLFCFATWQPVFHGLQLLIDSC